MSFSVDDSHWVSLPGAKFWSDGVIGYLPSELPNGCLETQAFLLLLGTPTGARCLHYIIFTIYSVHHLPEIYCITLALELVSI